MAEWLERVTLLTLFFAVASSIPFADMIFLFDKSFENLFEFYNYDALIRQFPVFAIQGYQN